MSERNSDGKPGSARPWDHDETPDTADQGHDHTLFDLIAHAPGETPCMIFNGVSLTYDRFRHRVLAFATGLHRNGIKRGDVVGLWLPTVPDTIALHFACAQIGAVVLSLNPRLGKKEIEDFVTRAACKALVYTPSWHGRDFDTVLEEVSPAAFTELRLSIAMATGGVSGRALPHCTRINLDQLGDTLDHDITGGKPEDRALIIPSSGTTGQPKLVVHGQARIFRRVRQIGRAFDITADSRLLLAVPFCGAYGYTVGMIALGNHATLAIMEQFTPQAAAHLLFDTRTTHMFGTNDMLDKIIDAAPEGWSLPALRMYGHANFTPGLVALPAKAERHGVHLRGCFGQTETLALFASQPDHADLERRSQSGGMPLAKASQVRVRCLETGALLAQGQIGKLELQTPDVMLEYLGNPSATAKAFTEDGFLRTGDLAYLTGDGGFIHVSRIGDVLRLGGYLVGPLEIEDVVLSVPGIKACQVVSVETGGSTRPIAFVIGDSTYRHDEADITRICRDRLAIYKVPVRVFQVDEFPVTPSPNGDKVKKTELRAMALNWMKEREGIE